MCRITDAGMEERKRDLLRYLYSLSNRQGIVAISHRRLVADLGLTFSQLRVVLAHSEESGFLKIKPRYAKDGGQCSNSYRITAKAMRFLSDEIEPA